MLSLSFCLNTRLPDLHGHLSPLFKHRVWLTDPWPGRPKSVTRDPEAMFYLWYIIFLLPSLSSDALSIYPFHPLGLWNNVGNAVPSCQPTKTRHIWCILELKERISNVHFVRLILKTSECCDCQLKSIAVAVCQFVESDCSVLACFGP